MNDKIYFDNNATTKCDEKVLESILLYLKSEYGNPSSVYSFGADIKDKITISRKNIANLLNCNKEEIVFTSCASESNQTAIMSAIRNNTKKRHIITTKVEHSSIMETMKYLEKLGYNITYLPVDEQGRLNLEDLKNAINDDTLLISVMMANNEIGNIYPIKEIGKIAKKNNILFHCDATQAIGKIKIDLKELNIDTLSFSGHKIYAPKGIGVLYIRNDIPYIPLIFGHQEKNRRGGTENVPYIIGIGEACKEIIEDNYEEYDRIKKLRDKLEKNILDTIDNVKVYGDKDNRIPNTLSIAFKDINPEKLMLMLESYNIYVSTGSACNSVCAEPSYVLTACNANLKNYNPIRISLGKYNTEEEIEYFVKILVQILKIN